MTQRRTAHKNWRPGTVALAIAIPLAVQIGLAGCAMGGMGDALPTAMGGLPEGAPARPADDKYQFPAVHDMPAGRANEPLDDNGQLKLQQDLLKLRDEQGKLAADPDAPPPPQAKTPGKTAAKPAALTPAQIAAQAAAKKNAATPKPGQTSSAKTNP